MRKTIFQIHSGWLSLLVACSLLCDCRKECEIELAIIENKTGGIEN
jgi:hypothetical protein